jgi:hypothetical protein
VLLTEYHSGDYIRKNRQAEHAARMGGKRFAYGFGVETCEKKPLGRPRHRWDVSIEMDFEK